MTDRIDHAVKAKHWVGEATQRDTSSARAAMLASVAQVHATLALAEQQRIANLIQLARIESENNTTPTDALLTIYDEGVDGHGNVSLTTRPEIRKALRIDD